MPKTYHEGTKVEYLGGSKIRFTCPAGHVTVKTEKVGPRGFKKPMSPVMVEKLAKYWQNRVTYTCKKC